MELENKKDHILKAARGLFLTHGFKATTMQSIADVANVSKGAVYLHFSSKKEVFREIARRADRLAMEKLTAVRNDSSLDAKTKLLRLFQSIVEFAHENRVLHELLIREAGVEISDSDLAEAQMFRRLCSTSIEESVVEYLGDEVKAWRGDLSFLLTGVLDAFCVSLFVEDIEMSHDQLKDFLMMLVDTMGKSLPGSSLRPMFDEEFLNARDDAIEAAAKSRKTTIQDLLLQAKELIGQTDESESDGSQRELIEETMKLLSAECDKETPNKALLQGLLTNLKPWSKLHSVRQQLAELLGVKLI